MSPALATTSSISCIWPWQCRIRSIPAAIEAALRSPMRPRKPVHRDIVGHQQPVEADFPCGSPRSSGPRPWPAWGRYPRSGYARSSPWAGRSAPGRRRNRSARVPHARWRPPGFRDGCRSRARPWPGICFMIGRTPASSNPSPTARRARLTSSTVRPRQRFCRKGMGGVVAMSSVGAQSLSMPDGAQFPPDQAIAQAHRLGLTQASSSGGSHSAQCGARIRCTRPPS